MMSIEGELRGQFFGSDPVGRGGAHVPELDGLLSFA